MTAPEYLAKVEADPRRAAALQRARERAAAGVPATEATDDPRRLDWLEQAYTEDAKDPKSWREFMTRVAEVGFRKAIDGVKETP